MTVRNIDSQTLVLQRKHVQRFHFNVTLIGAGTLSSVKLENVNVKISLKRGGQTIPLAHEHLLLLAIFSMYYNNIETPLEKTVITKDATTKVLPIMVDLGSVVNLFGEDEINVEVVTKSGWNGDFDSNSFIEFEERPAIGVEKFIPTLKSKSIQGSTDRLNESLGSNVSDIQLVNIESGKTGTDATRVFDNLIITSDKYNSSDNRTKLLSRRASEFESLALAMARGENFRFAPRRSVLDNVQLTVELLGSNVVGSKNYIVWRQLLISAATIARGNKVEEKHEERDAAKLGISK